MKVFIRVKRDKERERERSESERNFEINFSFLLPLYFGTRTHTHHTTSGLNFINVLCTFFSRVDPKSVKRYRQLD
jgi:hypothetical protein